MFDGDKIVWNDQSKLRTFCKSIDIRSEKLVWEKGANTKVENFSVIYHSICWQCAADATPRLVVIDFHAHIKMLLSQSIL